MVKGRFSTIDIAVVIKELTRFLGMRVVNVYDIDNKTYLIKVGKPDAKTFILIESGIRLHSTEFDWPKNPAPSNFSMKLRKHIKGRRLESIRQLGIDRIIDFQFGSNEAAYHVIAELYDRGNIVLTDHEYTILNILRPRTDNSQDVRFAVRETYPVEISKAHQRPTEERLREILQNGKEGDVLKKFLIPNLDYGPAVIEHVLVSAGFTENAKIGVGFQLDSDMSKLMSAIDEAEALLSHFLSDPCKGFILQKKGTKSNLQDGEPEEIVIYDEFHPFLFKQHEKKSFTEFESFDKAVDEFYSKVESQKLDMKVIQHEKTAMKKLDNVKREHEKRIQGLQKEQESDIVKGQLIEMNLELVDQAILIVRSALANQIDWTEIWALVKEAQMNNDPVALAIKGLKLDTNQITVLLKDPFPVADEDDESGSTSLKPMKVDLDLAVSAYGNSRKYFDRKKQAARKEQKTTEASSKAFKSAEKKTKQTLKEVQTAVSINKTRKTYWFEKFLWFITSENYLVIGGRDQQQNEMIVKRYMNQGDLYVHADLHGASSCVVKNPAGGPVPPKTLNEAGTMAICNSAAWDSKVVTSAWWVYQDQVSKTAPTGEYLTTGSFMIRGKKNYLPPSYLVYGFGFLFKLEDGSVERHAGERKVRTIEDDEMSVVESMTSASIAETDDIDLDISEGSSEDEADDNKGNADEVCENEEDDTKKGASGPIDEGSSEDNANDEDEESDEGEVCQDEEETKEMTNAENVAIPEATKMSKTEKCGDVKTEDKSDFAFPDTNIKLQHVKGDKYELQRENSETSYSFEPIYLGDSQPVVFGEKASGKKRLSAKERRDIKKGKKIGVTEGFPEVKEKEEQVSELPPSQPDEDLEDNNTDENDEEDNSSVSSKASKKVEKMSTPQDPHLNKRQRLKKKKLEKKYGHQDEEERKIKVALLNSAGSHKKKNKKEKEEVPVKPHLKGQQGPPKGQTKGQGQYHGNKELAAKPKEEAAKPNEEAAKPNEEVPQGEGKDKTNQHNAGSGKGGAESDGEKEDENAVTDDTALLNSLTGIPVSEDELLYAIPVCAPYNALLNFKFKVKLLPGSGKKGKAVKTALSMFLHERTTSTREKDLLKIQKDVELSRNMPGKVKVAAPNLHKRRR